MSGYGHTGGRRRSSHMSERPRYLMPQGADPFGYTKKSTAIRAGLRSAPKAKPSFGGLGDLLAKLLHGGVFPDDSFRNQFGQAQAGRLGHIDPHGLTEEQIHLLHQIMAGHSRGY